MFCYSVRKQVAAMVAALDGVDLIVFTGGIGENDPEARAVICRGLSWIGVSLDEARCSGAQSKCGGRAIKGTIRRTIGENIGDHERTLSETERRLGETDAGSRKPDAHYLRPDAKVLSD